MAQNFGHLIRQTILAYNFALCLSSSFNYTGRLNHYLLLDNNRRLFHITYRYCFAFILKILHRNIVYVSSTTCNEGFVGIREKLIQTKHM